jgi:hypothetical protein
MLILGTLISFGALFIPTYYFLFMQKSPPTNRRMYLGIGLQVLWTAMVAVLVYFAWRTGRPDYYKGWALLIPVNVVSAIYFVIALVVYNRDSKTKK